MPKKTKVKAKKIKKGKAPKTAAKIERATIISSEVVYQGPLFRILHDKLVEPGGRHNERDVIRHNGSVVILAIEDSKEQEESVDCDGAAIPARGEPVLVGAAGRQAGSGRRSAGGGEAGTG